MSFDDSKTKSADQMIFSGISGVAGFLLLSEFDIPQRVQLWYSDKIIAMEAAKHLEPCVFELGGRAPSAVSDAL